ncbi:MAG: branched-chain amino acid ABC transporter permease [Thermodesulfobacteriota bacterium]
MARRSLIAGVILFVLALAPVIVDLGNDTLNLLVMLFIYIILAQSWNLIGGYAGQINLGLAAFFGCGVLTTHLLWSAGAPFWLALPAGGILAGCLSVVIGIPTLRLRGAYFAMGTLALSEALRLTIGNVFTRTIYMPVSPENYRLLPRYYLALGVTALVLFVIWRLSETRPGLGMEAVREDEECAGVTGVNVFGHKLAAFVLSSIMAGLAGGVYAYYQYSILPFSSFLPLWTFEPLMATCIGGPGTFLGPLLGSVFLVILRELFALHLGGAHLIIFGSVFILVVLFLPEGLVGIGPAARREWRSVRRVK